ncbi:MAG TPA: YfiR family protein, partial [Cyclobacteriaceae bacterium]|nr:YfiR family protein [Cyclobacteriaceae bacterium]
FLYYPYTLHERYIMAFIAIMEGILPLSEQINPRKMKITTRILLVILISVTSAKAQERSTHEVYAAMLYNFIKYIQWPDEGAGGEFVVGVMGDDNVYSTLKQWYDGKPKGTKKYVIKKLATAGEASTCHVVYLGKARDFEGVKNSVTGRSVLTITDGNGLGQRGSCINFKVIDGKLRFELNQGVVADSNLRVSSQLSSMAILI